MTKKICVVTGTRAEYGLLKPLLELISKNKSFTLHIVVCGAHLSPDFGNTFKEIEDDGFPIDFKVAHLNSDNSPAGVTKSTGRALEGFAEAYSIFSPDVVVLLGDRYEIFAAAAAAHLMRIPIAHIHGGEVTTGALDDGLRHAITKLSTLHFTACEIYRNRVVQMGEMAENVYNTGALGIDLIRKTELMAQTELLRELDVDESGEFYLVTIHPETAGVETLIADEILQALENVDKYIVFTGSNADAGGIIINKKIEDFVKKKSAKRRFFMNLGSLRYLSSLKFASVVIGNSSSGIIEAPFFKVSVINVGTRQNGRVKSEAVIDCDASVESVQNSIKIAETPEFKAKLDKIVYPFGDGFASLKIIEVLENIDLSKIKTKVFYDMR